MSPSLVTAVFEQRVVRKVRGRDENLARGERDTVDHMGFALQSFLISFEVLDSVISKSIASSQLMGGLLGFGISIYTGSEIRACWSFGYGWLGNRKNRIHISCS